LRTKTIIAGAIAALALATLTANAANVATHRVQGSLVSLVAASTTVAKADRDAATAGAKGATHEESSESVAKPVVAVKPAAPKVVSTTPACQQAINSLKALRQADATEDAAERTGEKTLSASARQAEQTEDAAELLKWRNALVAARTACVPQPSAACQTAIAGVQALVPVNRTDWAKTEVREIDWSVDLASLRTAFGALAMACGDRD